MTHFAIKTDRALGVSASRMRKLAKEIGTDHKLALELWESDIHEARVVAALIDHPKRVTKAQMNAWVRQIDNWGVCDACCCVLFDKTPFAWDKAIEWSDRKEEFVRRAGFVLMAAWPFTIKSRLIKNSSRFSASSSVTPKTSGTS